ncbi:hypothetical protein SNE40_013748 [Patella caerulea]|uniref:SH3 domain-binding glutamic acid-rich-like protein 3 n=1 Tax=Patella caerulea TaxID=87958 RepID=A0AAN8PHN8_PATCE
MGKITIYVTTISCAKNIASQQQHIETVLKAKHVDYELIDIASCEGKKDEMREKMGDPTALPPQIFNGDIYCGNYEAFQNSVEEEDVMTFLHL